MNKGFKFILTQYTLVNKVLESHKLFDFTVFVSTRFENAQNSKARKSKNINLTFITLLIHYLFFLNDSFITC